MNPDGRIITLDVDMLRGHWRGLRNAGIAFLVLGALAIVLPLAAALAIDLVLGSLLLIGGLVVAFQAFGIAKSTRFWWQLGVGFLNALVGLLLLRNPMEGVLTLTVLLSILFLVEGGYKLVFAMPLRAVRGWTWLLASGLVSLLLGILIIAGLPGTAAWVLGVMVGINLVFTGFALISLARTLRQ